MAAPPPAQPPCALAVRRLLRTSVTASLATLDGDDGSPYASLVSVATAADAGPLMLMSRLARHWRNVEAEPRVSLLFTGASSGGDGDPLAEARASVMGHAARTQDAADLRRFKARHPAAFYVGFEDFALFRVEPVRAHLIAGFGRIETIDGRELLLDRADAGPLAEAEAEIVAHMNRDHADAVSLYATMILGAEPAPWEMIGLDPEGMDIAAGTRQLRLDFSRPVRDAGAAREMLVALAREARAGGAT